MNDNLLKRIDNYIGKIEYSIAGIKREIEEEESDIIKDVLKRQYESLEHYIRGILIARGMIIEEEVYEQEA